MNEDEFDLDAWLDEQDDGLAGQPELPSGLDTGEAWN